MPFCEPYAREQEAYFAMGKLTWESQGFRGGALDGMRGRGGGTSVGNGPRKERGPSLPSGYRLDQADPDAIVLGRPDGSEIATFSAVGAILGRWRRVPGRTSGAGGLGMVQAPLYRAPHVLFRRGAWRGSCGSSRAAAPPAGRPYFRASAAAACCAHPRRSLTFPRPSLARPLTVPSGTPSSSEVSDWVCSDR